MSETNNWRDAVKVVRSASINDVMAGPDSSGRATIYDFAGTGGQKTWVGMATVKPKTKTGGHHHGQHEVVIYVVKGKSEIRWGDRLEYAAVIGVGDLAYFTPFVPHQEYNISDTEDVVFLVVRSDGERIAVPIDMTPVEVPATVA
jgi:uncharacterized RmlC-like cupin family protein